MVAWGGLTSVGLVRLASQYRSVTNGSMTWAGLRRGAAIKSSDVDEQIGRVAHTRTFSSVGHHPGGPSWSPARTGENWPSPLAVPRMTEPRDGVGDRVLKLPWTTVASPARSPAQHGERAAEPVCCRRISWTWYRRSGWRGRGCGSRGPTGRASRSARCELQRKPAALRRVGAGWRRRKPVALISRPLVGVVGGDREEQPGRGSGRREEQSNAVGRLCTSTTGKPGAGGGGRDRDVAGRPVDSETVTVPARRCAARGARFVVVPPAALGIEVARQQARPAG